MSAQTMPSSPGNTSWVRPLTIAALTVIFFLITLSGRIPTKIHFFEQRALIVAFASIGALFAMASLRIATIRVGGQGISALARFGSILCLAVIQFLLISYLVVGALPPEGEAYDGYFFARLLGYLSVYSAVASGFLVVSLRGYQEAMQGSNLWRAAYVVVGIFVAVAVTLAGLGTPM